ncbi:MAG: hypothetical protein HC815_31170 [Richelia sp. RM1_1_1]|nr:hypothetical protein [Richelia sp. RM1_1_1]
MTLPSSPSSKTLSVLVIILLIGFLTLAILDESYRPAFADLAKVGIGGYLAMLIPWSR